MSLAVLLYFFVRGAVVIIFDPSFFADVFSLFVLRCWGSVPFNPSQGSVCPCSGPFASSPATPTPWWLSRCTTRSAPSPSAMSLTKVRKVSSSFACKLPALRSCVPSVFQPPYRRWSVTFPTRLAWSWTASAGKAKLWRRLSSWRRLMKSWWAAERRAASRL